MMEIIEKMGEFFAFAIAGLEILSEEVVRTCLGIDGGGGIHSNFLDVAVFSIFCLCPLSVRIFHAKKNMLEKNSIIK